MSYFGEGSSVRSVITFATLKPGSVSCRRRSARMRSPAEMSRTTDAITSATTRIDLARSRRPPPALAPSRNPPRSSLRDDNTEPATEHGENQTLCDRLANESLSSRAKRRSNDQLPAARQSTREQQVGEVCARDEEHAAGRAAKCEKEQS